jgi:hypothetical protein
MALPGWDAKQANLPRYGTRSMQRFWAEYQEKLSCVRRGTVFFESGIAASPEGGFSVFRPRRQPVWGRIAVAIAVTRRQICDGDGHTRAERREEAWYHF